MWKSAALLGVLGSVHCVAMCGPLVVACGRPAGRTGLAARVSAAATYHGGRLGTYALVGAGSGALVGLLDIGRYIALGVGIILIVVAGLPRMARLAPGTAALYALAARVAAAARHLHGRYPRTGQLVAGIANGLLPCGMVYAALGLAASSGSASEAALTMVAFGTGTLPALLVTTASVIALPESWRRRVRAAAPLGAAVVGALLLARGLSGVPADVDQPIRPAAHIHGP